MQRVPGRGHPGDRDGRDQQCDIARLVRALCRSLRERGEEPDSVTIVIPARNERGNIEPAIRRMRRFTGKTEIIFVEGHSRDGT